MVSLVIISNSPKTEHITQYLQATIKVTVDVVADIDQALQDIFVKRPTVVCIQNRISGINAEEIARHMQTLLRNGAPSFILLHEGDGSAKQVKGLFEHLLDLTLPGPELAEAFGSALKSILGPQWEHVQRVPRQLNDRLPEPAGTPQIPPRRPEAEEDNPFVLVNSLDDFFTAMPAVQSAGQKNNAHHGDAPVAAVTLPGNTPGPAPRKGPAATRRLPAEPGTPAKRATSHPPVAQETSATPPVTSEPPPTTSLPLRSTPAHKVSATSTAPSPGDFHITAPAIADGAEENDIAPFIESFEMPDRRWKRWAGTALVVMVCAAAGAWHLLRQKPEAVTAVHPSSLPASGNQPKPVPVPAVVHTAASSARPSPPPPVVRPLPVFVPADGHDSHYAARHPGWERYTGTRYECRIFREKGGIKAVQVLAGKQPSLDEGVLKRVLTELAGSTTYRTTSRERVAGYEVERGQMDGRADLMLYRKNSKLHAIVVSLH